MNKKKIFIWCCDYSKNTGEGIVANKFVNDLKSYNKNLRFKINIPKNKKKNILFERIIYPLSGILYLWKIYVLKNNKEVCYVNYLPFWNFLLFFLMPPRTILGPITGGSLFDKKVLINYFLRNYVLNFFNFLSFLIIKMRNRKLLFSTDLLKSNININNQYYFNYVLKDLKIKKINIKKEYDLIFYLNNHKNKSIDLQIRIANKLSTKFKIITVGKKIKNSRIKNLGYVPRKYLLKVLQRTKFAFLSPENLYSLFAIDSISSNTNIFFNGKNNYRSEHFKGIYYLNYNDYEKLVIRIEKVLMRKFLFKANYRALKKSFANYFEV